MSEMNKVQRLWDEYDAYLFDIDGTLLNCTDAVHYFAFCETLTGIAGRPLNLDGVTTHGNVDVGILRDALARAEIPESQWRPRLGEMKAAMADFAERDQGNFHPAVLPFVREALEHLRGRGAVLGVATGNLEVIGRLKLRHCGLLDYFQFGGFSDEFEYRRDVIRAAVEKARGIAGAGATVCVVGDTPEDVRAAKANGLAVIAVATGLYTLEQLTVEEPDLCVRSLGALVSAKPH